MTMSGERLVIDPQSRFLGMKSVQPYSTTDEYLYAMKQDLDDWLSNMYPEWRPITADHFLESLGKKKQKKIRTFYACLRDGMVKY